MRLFSILQSVDPAFIGHRSSGSNAVVGITDLTYQHKHAFSFSIQLVILSFLEYLLQRIRFICKHKLKLLWRDDNPRNKEYGNYYGAHSLLPASLFRILLLHVSNFLRSK